MACAYTNNMDLDDLRSVANVICYRLDLPPCEVRIGHGRGSRYVPAWEHQACPQPQIIISEHDPDQLQALLHELTHHADAKRVAEAYQHPAWHNLKPARVSVHGPAFVGALKHILTLWYGPDWQQHYTQREYARVAVALGLDQTKQALYQCSECGKRFYSRSSILKHIRKHQE